MSEDRTAELIALLGDDAFVALSQAFGGTRLYVPNAMAEDHEIAAAIGIDAARRLSRRYSSSVLRVPLARNFRARHYRKAGRSLAQIARLVGMTESSVDRLFRRIEQPVSGRWQLLLFPDDI